MKRQIERQIHRKKAWEEIRKHEKEAPWTVPQIELQNHTCGFFRQIQRPKDRQLDMHFYKHNNSNKDKHTLGKEVARHRQVYRQKGRLI